MREFGHLPIRIRNVRRKFAGLELTFLCGCLICAFSLVRGAAADEPLKKLATFTAFSSIDIKRLEAGEILGEPGSQMDFANGISTETSFAVPLPAADAAKRIQLWDPSLHGTVKTMEFHSIPKLSTAADFECLKLNLANRPQRWLLDKSLATTSAKSDLHLSREECQRLATLAKTKLRPENVDAYWAGVLLARAKQFHEKGFAGLPSYEVGSQLVSPHAHLRSLMTERESISREFSALLRDCGMLGGDGKATLDPFLYWALYEANRHAEGDRFQLLDVQYYVNGTYYTSATLYEVWPIQIGLKPAALIWRGDFFSAPKLAYTRGVERLAFAAIILQELKTSIRSFQSDALKPIIEPASNSKP